MPVDALPVDALFAVALVFIYWSVERESVEEQIELNLEFLAKMRERAGRGAR
jgi:hypothetical protein